MMLKIPNFENIFEESNINHTKSKGGYGGSSHDATKAGDWCSLKMRSRRQKLYRHKVQEHWKHQKASGFHLTRRELRIITHQELKLCIKLQRFTKNPPRDVPKAKVLDFAERVSDRDPSIMRKESISVTLCHLDSREDLEKFTRHALVDWIQLQGSETTYEANKAQLLELAQKIYNGDPQLVPQRSLIAQESVFNPNAVDHSKLEHMNGIELRKSLLVNGICAHFSAIPTVEELRANTFKIFDRDLLKTLEDVHVSNSAS